MEYTNQNELRSLWSEGKPTKLCISDLWRKALPIPLTSPNNFSSVPPSGLHLLEAAQTQRRWRGAVCVGGDPARTIFFPTCRVTPPRLFSTSDQFRVCALRSEPRDLGRRRTPSKELGLAGSRLQEARVPECRKTKTYLKACGRRRGGARETKALRGGSEDSLGQGQLSGKPHLPPSLNFPLSRRSAGAQQLPG